MSLTSRRKTQSDNGEEAPEQPVRHKPGYDPDVDPQYMQGSESLYGYVVALELIVVSIINLVDTGGKGAPKHPETTLSVIALLLSVLLVGLIVTKKRTVVAFGAIAAAFFVTLPKVPTRLAFVHVFALAFPAAYGIVLATRRRRGEKLRLASGAASGPPRRRAEPAAARRSGRRSAPPETGPARNRRYTPPKPKRRVPPAS